MTTRVWPFKPSTATVAYEWLTDIVRCKTAEYRASIRPVPRMSYIYQHIMDADAYSTAGELARTIGGDPVYVPEWPWYAQTASLTTSEVTIPVDATNVPGYKAGGYLLVWESNVKYEVCRIQTIGDDTITIYSPGLTRSYTTPRVMPIRLGTFAQEFGSDRKAADYTECEAVFDVTETEDLNVTYGDGTAYMEYLGVPVVSEPAELLNGVRDGFERATELLDSRTGPLNRHALYSTPNRSAVISWYLERSALWQQLLWVHARKGRWKSFWVSSWNADVVVTRDIWSGDTTIEIAAMSFSSFYPNPTDLAISTTDGVGWIVRVTGATAGDPGKELLTLSAPFVGIAEVATISKTSRLTLSRFDSDRVEVAYRAGGAATIVIPTQEVPA